METITAPAGILTTPSEIGIPTCKPKIESKLVITALVEVNVPTIEKLGTVKVKAQPPIAPTPNTGSV